MCVPRLFHCFLFTSLKECFLHVQMPAFNNPICLRIICWDLYMSYPIYLCEIFHSHYKSCTIISDNFRNSSPTTQNLFMNKLPDCFASLWLHYMPLRPPYQSVSSMQYVMISSWPWHIFYVNVYFSKEGKDVRNDQRDYCLLYAIQLILVAGLYEPLNVRIYLWLLEMLD